MRLNICSICIIINLWNNRVTGCVGLHSYGMEVELMKNQNKFEFRDLLSFGLFLLALLTFVFTFCK
ncbi:MAG: hypothetical protein E7268_02210 [Lachnospiraceae bacterium]|nr:hypothetical protein [Lachnospiraceae bacterium]